MKKSLLKPILLMAICLCLGSVLFATLSLGKTAYASSTVHTARTTQSRTAKPSSCNVGSFQTTLYASDVKTLYPGQAWFAITCSVVPVVLGFQEDGNLVLYIGGQAKWSSHTNGICVRNKYNNNSAYAVFQKDGNFVIYDCYHNAPVTSTWPSNTSQIGSWLSVQEDGNVVIYSSSGVAVWSTKTCCY